MTKRYILNKRRYTVHDREHLTEKEEHSKEQRYVMPLYLVKPVVRCPHCDGLGLISAEAVTETAVPQGWTR